MSCGLCGGCGSLDDGATAREIVCPVCEGEGHVYEAVPGGRWNTSIGTWEPDERRVTCERCDGSGEIDICDEYEEEAA